MDHTKRFSVSRVSLPRFFRTWSWIYQIPFGSFRNLFFVFVYWGSYPAVASYGASIKEIDAFTKGPQTTPLPDLFLTTPM